MAIKPRKIESEVEAPIEAPVVMVSAPEPEVVGGVLPGTADEQLAGQIALASAEDRLKAELEAGKRAVAEAEARRDALAAE